MPVTVHLLASPLRGKVDNRPALELPFVEGETVRAFLEPLFRAYPALRPELVDAAGDLLFEYQIWYADEMVRSEDFDRALKDGDALAFLLPMSGGARLPPVNPVAASAGRLRGRSRLALASRSRR